MLSWFSGKNKFSIENLHSLVNQLLKNQVITEQNKDVIVENLRCIAELMIWGDQNGHPAFFDFFLEKNILGLFLKILRQKCNKQVKIQLIQTLSIMIQNIKSRTSVYYLLSNNHINDLINHRFDFEDEELMSYYISFLKVLSLKLDGNTIQFFYVDNQQYFPLYTEAVKFFNHTEGMVRIAVRTLTLNVYRLDDTAMRKFIINHARVHYFPMLVASMRERFLEIDYASARESSIFDKNKLENLLNEHLDVVYYINDILILGIQELCDILCSLLLDRLVLPVLIGSLVTDEVLRALLAESGIDQVDNILDSIFLQRDDHSHNKAMASMSSTPSPLPSPTPSPAPSPPPMLSSDPLPNLSISSGGLGRLRPSVSCFLLSHIMSVISYGPLLSSICSSLFCFDAGDMRPPPLMYHGPALPSSEQTLARGDSDNTPLVDISDTSATVDDNPMNTTAPNTITSDEAVLVRKSTCLFDETNNLEDSRKEKKLIQNNSKLKSKSMECSNIYRNCFLEFLSCEDDRCSLNSALLLWTIVTSPFVDKDVLEMCNITPRRGRKTKLLLASLTGSTILTQPSNTSESVPNWNEWCGGLHGDYPYDIVDKLLTVMGRVPRPRLITLEVFCRLISEFVITATGDGQKVSLDNAHVAKIEEAYSIALNSLKELFLIISGHKSSDSALSSMSDIDKGLFLEMFEDEALALREFCTIAVPKVYDRLLTDSILILPIAGTALSGIDMSKRLPSGDLEVLRKTMQSYLLVRSVWNLCVASEGAVSINDALGVNGASEIVKRGSCIDLQNMDVISCTLMKPQSSASPAASPVDLSKSPLKNRRGVPRYIVVDEFNFLLVAPDRNRIGWAEVQDVASLMHVEAVADKLDSRVLNVVVQGGVGSSYTRFARESMVLVFDDNIRCLAAKQHLDRGRQNLRDRKLAGVMSLLEETNQSKNK